MTTATATEERAALLSIKRSLESDREPDQIIRLFNQYRPALFVRLRQLYAVKLECEAAVRDNDAQIVAAQLKLQEMRWHYQAELEAMVNGSGLPSDERIGVFTLMKERAAVYHDLLDRWNGRVLSLQLKADDAGNEFDREFSTWKNLRWRMTGDAEVRPAMVTITRDTDASGWTQPDAHQRAYFETILAQLEA